MTQQWWIALVVVAGMVASSQGATITYVDATVNGNTTLANGDPMVLETHYTTSALSDDKWNVRVFANGGSIFGSNETSTGTENPPRLRTTISNLAPGEPYNVYGYFWGANGGTWRGRIGLTNEVPSLANPSGDLQGYNSRQTSATTFLAMTPVTRLISNDGGLNGTPLSTSTTTTTPPAAHMAVESGGYFANSVLTEEGDRSLYQVTLGIAYADVNGRIPVYVDNHVISGTVNRTWYDGVGYSLVVPEPSTVCLAIAGTLAACVVGRRRRGLR